MAIIKLNFSQDNLDKFSEAHRYQAEVFDPSGDSPEARMPNPESQIDFVERKVIEFAFDSIEALEVQKVIQVARKDKREQLKKDIKLKDREDQGGGRVGNRGGR